jgi:hypothetical protein
MQAMEGQRVIPQHRPGFVQGKPQADARESPGRMCPAMAKISSIALKDWPVCDLSGLPCYGK